jgi:GDPmannose 4,6-dehydratase
MWAMLQQPYPDDFVIATGKNHSVREFIEKAFLTAGMQIAWTGKGLKETGIVKSITDPAIPIIKKGDALISVDPRYFRPTEVENLLGDPAKAKEKLNWKSSVSFNELVEKMVKEDLIEAKKDQLCNNAGFKTYSYLE